MKILIIEDESLAAERLENMLKEIDHTIEVVGSLKSVEGSLKWLMENQEPDLIISDIQLSDSICFDIFIKIKPSCPVIFTTAYDQYAIQAFEVNSIDYLLKPIQLEKLKTSIEKFHELKSGYSNAQPDMTRLMDIILKNQQEYKSRFLVKVGNKIRSIQVDSIAYFYTHEKMTYIVSYEGPKYPIDHSLEEISTMLDPKYFFRINRKYVIHINAIKEIHPYFKGRLKIMLKSMKEDDNIVVSSEKTPDFKAWLNK